MRNFNLPSLPRQFAYAVLIGLAAVATTAAQSGNGFDFGVGPSVGLLLASPEIVASVGDPDGVDEDTSVDEILTGEMKRVMWVTNVFLEVSQPEFLIVNNNESDDVITTVEIEIAASGFSFANLIGENVAALQAPDRTYLPDGIAFDLLDADGDVVPAGSVVPDPAGINSEADTLRIDFTGLSGGGLSPGDSFSFVTQVATDDGLFAAFDKGVLFSTDGDISNNAVVSVTFADSLTGSGTTSSSFAIPDVSAEDQVANAHRQFVSVTPANIVSVPVPVVVPEPASCLHAAGVLVLVLSRSRRKKSPRSL